VLDRFTVENYRLFGRLELAHLGRVNLITGANGVGKTALIEALRLYARAASPGTVRSLLASRYELDEDERGLRPASLAHLFRGRSWEDTPRIKITGASGSQTQETVLRLVHQESPQVRLPLGEDEPEPAEDDPRVLVVGRDGKETPGQVGRLSSWEGPREPSTHVPPGGLGVRALANAWAEIALSPSEDLVLDALRIVNPRIERIAVRATDEQAAQIRVRLTGEEEPVGLHSLGHGLPRLLGLALALVNSRGGLVLLDEIENGIHYSAQDELWRFVFAAARKFDTQVFATTHSYDCIRAFATAAAQDPGEGVLIRLERADNDVRATLFTESELQIVTRDRLEVR
jgi:hypothetical protein